MGAWLDRTAAEKHLRFRTGSSCGAQGALRGRHGEGRLIYVHKSKRPPDSSGRGSASEFLRFGGEKIPTDKSSSSSLQVVRAAWLAQTLAVAPFSQRRRPPAFRMGAPMTGAAKPIERVDAKNIKGSFAATERRAAQRRALAKNSVAPTSRRRAGSPWTRRANSSPRRCGNFGGCINRRYGTA